MLTRRIAMAALTAIGIKFMKTVLNAPRIFLSPIHFEGILILYYTTERSIDMFKKQQRQLDIILSIACLAFIALLSVLTYLQDKKA